MNDNKVVYKALNQARWFLIIGIVIIIVSPIILTSSSFWSRFDFTETGQIGDTIGGITAPFVNLLGAILVYLALKAQVQANHLVQAQIHDQGNKDKIQNQSNEITQLYNNLKEGIDNFTYISLDVSLFGKGQYLTGSEAIYKLFEDFYCNCHIDEKELQSNPKITELTSILEICDAVLIKLNSSIIPNKEVMRTLANHQFRYRILPRIHLELDNLSKYFCNSCNTDHGIPENLVHLIKKLETVTK